MDKPKRADFMTPGHKKQMADHPRTHSNCIAHTGVARPGKTAHDRWKKSGGQT